MYNSEWKNYKIKKKEREKGRGIENQILKTIVAENLLK